MGLLRDRSQVRICACAWIALLLAVTASAQLTVVGPAPYSEPVARQKIRGFLQNVDSTNRQQTTDSLTNLLKWYRDLIDEELITVWQTEPDKRSDLAAVIDPLATPRVAAGIMDFSWRERDSAFRVECAPMYEHLMTRYANSGKPMLDGLPSAADLSDAAAETVCRILIKCMLTPQVRGNAGCYKPFTVRAPEGSILNCRRPAAVNLRPRTGWYLSAGIFRALAEAAPDRVQAFTGLPVAVSFYGQERSGRLYSDHLFMGGGQGASQHRDGKSALLWPTSAANTSIELFETRVPVLVLEKSLVPDSGGAGRHRGGLGQRVRFRKLHDNGLPTMASLYPEGVGISTEGFFGGRSGSSAFAGIRSSNGSLLHDCGTGELITLSTTCEFAELILTGGSGFGDPLERSADAIAADLADGYVRERP